MNGSHRARQNEAGLSAGELSGLSESQVHFFDYLQEQRIVIVSCLLVLRLFLAAVLEEPSVICTQSKSLPSRLVYKDFTEMNLIVGGRLP